jgi:hypothetical protein
LIPLFRAAPIGLFAFALATAFYMTSQESFDSNPNNTANLVYRYLQVVNSGRSFPSFFAGSYH